MSRKLNHLRRVRVKLLAAAFSMAGALAGVAQARPDITPGVPATSGTVSIQVEKNDGTKPVIIAKVPPKGDMNNDDWAAAKKKAIENALTKENVGYSDTRKGINVDCKSLKKIYDGTGETDLLSMIGGPDDKYYASINWAGQVTPDALIGSEPVYNATLGWDGFAVNSSFGYSDLASPTTDAVIDHVYSDWLAGLPAPYQSALRLDMMSHEISFDYPSGIAMPFIGAGNTSEFSWAEFTIQSSVPEPACAASAAIGAAGALLRRPRR
jgi:hypothetical protein